MFAIPFARSRGASAALIALAVAGGAKADRMPASADVPTSVVRYGDLDLATDAGAAAFRARAHRAVVGMYDDSQIERLADRVAREQAKRTALARADAQVAATVERARAGTPS